RSRWVRLSTSRPDPDPHGASPWTTVSFILPEALLGPRRRLRMTGIRKFVVGAAAAAGMAAIGMVLATQGALASTAWFDPGSQVRAATTQSTFTPSAACTAAIQALKEAITADRAEDAAERAVAKTEGTEAADQAEDAAEI